MPILNIAILIVMLAWSWSLKAQTGNKENKNDRTTFKNPVLPGDHPDLTLLKVGDDFYSSGSSFHFNPYVCIYHSTDLVHWEVISRAVPSSWFEIGTEDGPQQGIWQGSVVYFNNYYWVFFSRNNYHGQYFCKATNPGGPWSKPVQVTGSYGYDNSVFVDDDGRIYMLIKDGKSKNRIQELNAEGQLIGTEMNLDWVNAGEQYSWAEGPVMCKRNGRYYYFVAGDVSGGQYVLSSAELTAKESSWTRHGSLWPDGNNISGFNGPNHVSPPVQLADGTWWILSHSYEKDWEGQGRQGLLHQVKWDEKGVPQGILPNPGALPAPKLPSKGIPYCYPKSDLFDSTTLNLNWHFFNTSNAKKYSLADHPGYLRLKPGAGTTHILQKDAGKNYSMITKVDTDVTKNAQEAGLRMMNGYDKISATLYIGYSNDKKKIGFGFNGNKTEVDNTIGNVVWLKIERKEHYISGYYSPDGSIWKKIGSAIDITDLDKSQENFNGWVGNSIGLYATNIKADFDQFLFLADLPR
jgi:beta-xylosidase